MEEATITEQDFINLVQSVDRSYSNECGWVIRPDVYMDVKRACIRGSITGYKKDVIARALAKQEIDMNKLMIDLHNEDPTVRPDVEEMKELQREQENNG